MKKSALISGASGLVGQELLQLTLDNPSYSKVYILVRKSLGTSHPKLVEIIFDYENDQDYRDLPVVDDTFCCLGTTIKKAGSEAAFKKVDFTYPFHLAQEMQEHKTNSFNVITALGADAESSIFYNKVKGELEDALKRLKFAHLFIYQPSLLVGNREENRLGEKVAIKIFPIIEFFMIGGLKKYKSIKVENVAKGMIYTALQDQSKFKIIPSDEIQNLATHYTSL